MTAVEFLVEGIIKLTGINIAIDEPIIEQAKEMERQRIIDAYNIGFITPIEFDFNTGKSVTAEQYYNETYKK
jgi:hypothetical protein